VCHIENLWDAGDLLIGFSMNLPVAMNKTTRPPALPAPSVEPEYMRVRPFLKLSGWSKSTLYRINQRHSLLIKVGNATFVDLKAWRAYMAACPRVGGRR
jgi:hypothetical protein